MPTLLSLLSDSSFQRKIAVALCAFLALFSAKIPFLASVTPEMMMAFLGVVAIWIGQSGAKAAVQAHAEGQANAAMIANATDAEAVFNHIVANNPGPLKQAAVEGKVP